MQNKTPLYFDYAATTPVDNQVADRMMHYLTMAGDFGNPASVNHHFGRQAKAAVEAARRQVANSIGAKPAQIIWTSGATESCNLGLKGAARNLRQNGSHIIAAQTEHKAVLDVCHALEQEDFSVTYVKPTPSGLIDPSEFEEALRPDTILASIMHVNNETGVIQDIANIGQITKHRNIVLHVDAAQSVGKLPVAVEQLGADLLSICAHKAYGPKGIGALYVRDPSVLGKQALIHGGGHEWGLRAGTLPTHQIVGMGQAFKIAEEELTADELRISQLKQRLWTGLQTVPGTWLSGSFDKCVGGILNVGFEDVNCEDLMLELSDIALSSGAACSSFAQEPSHVLKAMGLSDDQIGSTVRFSFGRFTSTEEIDYVIEAVADAVKKLRK
ncbi:MAG: aminotransferase class V-fold PLP-dependent enzyme [Arenicellales bacterium]|nr:aminotransferase class V-fold PLP-dependent enzyme [Arenicellales bacterium]